MEDGRELMAWRWTMRTIGMAWKGEERRVDLPARGERGTGMVRDKRGRGDGITGRRVKVGREEEGDGKSGERGRQQQDQ